MNELWVANIPLVCETRSNSLSTGFSPQTLLLSRHSHFT